LLLILAIAAFAAGAAGLPGATGAAFIFLLIFALAEFAAYMRYATSEFAITDRRVIIKVGWIGRRSLELLLSKIESIAVEQDLEGRLFDFGTIVVMGTGGTREPFQGIRSPIEFRNSVQTQIAALRTTEPRVAGSLP